MNKIIVTTVRQFGKTNKKIEDGYYIYCGRPSKYGNPFWMKDESMREQVIKDFKEKTLNKLDLTELLKLLKEDNLYLGCFCAPKACHCDVIKEKLEQLLTLENESKLESNDVTLS